MFSNDCKRSVRHKLSALQRFENLRRVSSFKSFVTFVSFVVCKPA